MYMQLSVSNCRLETLPGPLHLIITQGAKSILFVSCVTGLLMSSVSSFELKMLTFC